MEHKRTVVCLLILALGLVLGNSVCLADYNPEATKKLREFITENMAVKKMSAKQVAEIRSLIKQGANVDTADSNGVSLLLAASQNGQFEVVKLLLAKGAQVDKPARMYFEKDSIDSDINFKQGTQVMIGKGGFKLKGISYPEETKLIVGKDGNYTRQK